MRSAWLLRGVLQCFSWQSFQVPRYLFQLRHVTCFRCRHRSCKTLDCFRDFHTVLRQVRTSHGSAPKRCRSLSFKNWAVLNCFLPPWHSLNFTLGVLTPLLQIIPRYSSNWRTCFCSASISINSLLITLTDLCSTSSSLSKCSAAPIMPIRLVSNFSCNSFPKLSI